MDPLVYTVIRIMRRISVDAMLLLVHPEYYNSNISFNQHITISIPIYTNNSIKYNPYILIYPINIVWPLLDYLRPGPSPSSKPWWRVPRNLPWLGQPAGNMPCVCGRCQVMLASLVGFGWTKSWIWMFWWEISREISDEEGFGWTIW